MDKKLKEILKRNEQSEKEAPYNFCDRWCERCPQETQHRCKLYLDELDRRVTNIAHGRDEDDVDIFREEFGDEFELAMEEDDGFPPDDDTPWEYDEKCGEPVDDEWQKKQEELKSHPLQRTTLHYAKKTHDFLKKAFYENDEIPTELIYDFETISWYHTLLSAKMFRALCGLYDAEDWDDEDFELCDAVAQLTVCKKAIVNSQAALRQIREHHAGLSAEITELLALLNNIYSRIALIEDEI